MFEHQGEHGSQWATITAIAAKIGCSAEARARPNPFNPSVTIEFDVLRPSYVEADIFDVTGRHLRRLASGTFPAGTHARAWDGRDDSLQLAAAGIYVVRLVVRGNNYEETIVEKKIVLVK